MSTHQMHQVEELCDRLILIDKGRQLLYGGLHEIQKQYAANDILIQTTGKLPDRIKGVSTIQPRNGTSLLKLEKGTSPESVLSQLLTNDLHIEKFEIALPSLDDIFIRVVSEKEVVHE